MIGEVCLAMSLEELRKVFLLMLMEKGSWVKQVKGVRGAPTITVLLEPP